MSRTGNKHLIDLYENALEHYRKRDYSAAMGIVEELEKLTSNWLRLSLLKAYILRDNKKPVSELNSLVDLLNLADVLAKENSLSVSDNKIIAEAWSMLGSVCVLLGDCGQGVKAFLQSSIMEDAQNKKLIEYSNAIFAANYCGDYTSDAWQKLYYGYREMLKPIAPMILPKYKHKRIRVGYLSADLCKHPVAWFLRPLLEWHDRACFDIYLYQVNSVEDEITYDLVCWADEIRVVADWSYQEIASKIASDEIDILVDLSGHSKENRLPVLAYRPAPVLLSAIGYFNSTGLPIDGFLSDKYCSLCEHHPEYVESLIQLSNTHFCYQPWHKFPEICQDLPVIRNGYITFGCFNNFSKVTDEMLLLWKEILLQCKSSRLILKHSIFSSEEGCIWTKNRLHKLGIPVDRIEFRSFSADYLNEYNDVDIALDTFPYTGGLTTCECLMMGVPVVTLYGSRHGTRFGYSFLNNLGIGELACVNRDDYVTRASALSKDIELLHLFRNSLRKMMLKSPLMDGKKYCLQVECEYKKLVAKNKIR